MQHLVSRESLAFRSHPLFPLLRDLVIADKEFYDPEFPLWRILNLPSDCNKLLTVRNQFEACAQTDTFDCTINGSVLVRKVFVK